MTTEYPNVEQKLLQLKLQLAGNEGPGKLSLKFCLLAIIGQSFGILNEYFDGRLRPVGIFLQTELRCYG